MRTRGPTRDESQLLDPYYYTTIRAAPTLPSINKERIMAGSKPGGGPGQNPPNTTPQGNPIPRPEQPAGR